MFTLLSPETFKTIPWKNGLGHTTELAISDGGTLDEFDWRLSIASVTNDGDFSNFSGYQRNLVLIEGEGLTLDHRNGDIDNLTSLLDIANFDGGCNTQGKLLNGAIKDFNIMTNQESYSAKVSCSSNKQCIEVEYSQNSTIFAYCLTGEMTVNNSQGLNCSVPVGHLMKFLPPKNDNNILELSLELVGENMIVIELLPTKIIDSSLHSTSTI